MNEKHKCCTGHEREKEREAARERVSAGTRENSFLFGLRLCQQQEQQQQQPRVLLLWRALQHCFAHTNIARQRAGKKALCQTCCSCYCALSLSRLHCVKLAPLIVVAAAVHFNALFRTPFPLFPPPSSLCFCRCNLNEAFN